MHLEVITPDKKVFNGEISSVSLPGTNGGFEILKDHAPLISSLAKGNMKIVSKDGVKNMYVEGGTVEVLDNKIVVLAESANEAK
jgi:F-type H+-transporting ATPase subunit epsilon